MLSVLQHDFSYFYKNRLAEARLCLCTLIQTIQDEKLHLVVVVHTCPSHRGNTKNAQQIHACGLCLWSWATLRTRAGTKSHSLGRMPPLVHTQPKIPCKEKGMSGTIVQLLLSRNQLLCSSKTLVCKICLPADQHPEGTLLTFLCFCSFQLCLSCRNGLFLLQQYSDNGTHLKANTACLYFSWKGIVLILMQWNCHFSKNCHYILTTQ